jgi:hypothetical protein
MIETIGRILSSGICLHRQRQFRGDCRVSDQRAGQHENRSTRRCDRRAQIGELSLNKKQVWRGWSFDRDEVIVDIHRREQILSQHARLLGNSKVAFK